MTHPQIKLPNKDFTPLELIRNHKYHKIIEILSKVDLKSDSERYIYSYALFQANEYLSALINLWPLAKKDLNLQKDCLELGMMLFKSQDFSAAINDDKVLYMLLQIAKIKVPKAKIELKLQQKLFNLLWREKNYSQLENILKTYKKDKNGLLLENLSKVNFWQYEQKAPANVFGFIGYTLTGAGCLILREKKYHANLAQKINFIIDEIKQLFLAISSKWKNKILDLELLNVFLEYEGSILIKVLSVAINAGLELDFIATPSYFINYDQADLLLPKFKLWLQEHAIELKVFYEQATYYAVVGLLNCDHKILKKVALDKLDPAILAAIKLRNIKIPRVDVNLNDLKNSLELFKQILLNIITIMLKGENNQRFWEYLMELNVIIQDQELSYVLTNKLLKDLEISDLKGNYLNLQPLENFVSSLNDISIKEQLEYLFNRKNESIELLSTLEDVKNSKRIINSIKDRESLLKHLSLIADLQFLLSYKLLRSLPVYFRHVKRLILDRKINKIEPLAKYADLNCDCKACQIKLYNTTIPYLIDLLNLEIICLPKSITYIKSDEKQTSTFRSILSTDDPCATLGVDLSTSKALIIQKMLTLIREFPDKAASFKEAQHELFDLGKRFSHHYFRYLSFSDEGYSEFTLSDYTPEIPFREEFLYAKK